MSGGIRVISIYANRLRQRGHEVLAVSVPPRPLTVRERLRAFVKGSPTPTVRRASHLDHVPVRHVVVGHQAPITDADVPNADVVIATWWETAEWVWGLSASKGAKVHFMQDYETWGGFVERVDATCRLAMPKIVIAGWVRDLLVKRFGQLPLALVPNSVETEKFFAPPRGKQVMPTVGLTYTTMHNKGTDISLAAYRMAQREIPELRLVSFGSSVVSADLPLPVGAEYHYLAPDAMLPELYGGCDAWLFGTRIEGFGLPILEAMACRTPVIGTPAGAAPELLARGGGILVPGEDAKAMAEAIVKVIGMSEEEWRRMSEAALATATGYSWEDATDRFEAALQYVNQHRDESCAVGSGSGRTHAQA